MAIIQSGATSTLWTIDPTSTAGRVTLYDQYGNAMSDVNSLSNILNALNSNVTIVLGGQATLGINVSGTAGTLTLSFEATIDNSTWFPVTMTPATEGSTVTSTSADGQWVGSVSGYYAVRARVSSFTSGSMTVSVVITPGQSKTGAQTIIPAGTLSVEITDGYSDGPVAVKPASTAAIATDTALVVAVSPNNTVAVTQSGTWTNTVTQVTAANLNATVVGTTAAGSGASTGLITIQGNVGGTPVPISGTLTASTDGYATTSSPTYVNNTFEPLSLTLAGALRVDGSAVTQPVSGTVTANQGTSPWTDNISQFGGSAVVTGTGTSGAGIPRVTVSNDSNVLATQSGTWTVQPGNTPNTTPWLSTISQGGNSATVTAGNALKVDGSAVTQPVSATSLPLPTGAATSANQTNGSQETQIVQGGNTATVTASSALKVDGSAVTQPVSGTVTANAGTGTFTVSGTVTANAGTGNFTNASIGATASAPPADATYAGALVTTSPESGLTSGDMYPLNLSTTGLLRVDGSNVTQPVSGTVAATQSGTWTVQPGNTANTTPWLATISQGGNSATVTGSNALKVDGSAVTQPISAAALPLPSGAATASNQTTLGTQTTELNDGTHTAVIKAASTAAIATDTALVVAISPNNTPILPSGAATSANQTNGSQETQIVQGGNTATVTASSALKVDGSAVTQPISGTVTANAGTGNFTNASIGATAAAPPADATYAGALVTTSPESGLTSGDMYPLNLSTTGLLRVDGSNVTQPISGTVTANAGTGTFTVSGTVAATQSGTWTVQPGNTPNTTPWLATISQGGNSATVTASNALKVDGSAVTQPISAASLPLPTGAATSANQTTIGTQTTELNDGTRTATIKAASTAAVATDTALVVAVSPNNTIAATQSGTWTVQPGNTANTTPWLATINQGGNSATVTGSNALKVDGSAVTQPISGTVTANAGTGNFNNASVGATAASPPADATYVGGLVTTAVESGLTNNDMYPLSLTTAGLLRVDGSNVTQPVSGTVTANAGTGNFTVVQGTAANLNATVTGTVAATQSGTWTVQPGNTANTTPWLATINQGGNSATVTVGNALKVDGSAVTQPVSGTVTANAGTGTFTVSGTVTANAGTGNFNNASVGATAAAPPADATYVGGLVTTAVESGLTNNDMYPLSLTTAGLLRVDGSNVTQPVSGTVTANAGTGNFTVVQATAANLNATVTGTVAATQSGTWTVQPGNTANTTPWLATINQGGNSATVTASNALKVDGSAVTQPISAASLPLPTGAATSSNQTTLGTQTTELNDGTRTATIKAASTQSVSTDTALVVALSPGSAQTRAATTTVTGVASSTTSVTILASNTARVGAIITNSSTSILYLRYSATAAAISSGNYTIAVAVTLGTHEVYAGYTGTITGIWATANGFANVTEISP